MKVQANNTQESQNLAPPKISNETSKGGTAQLVDNRTIAIDQRKLQETMHEATADKSSPIQQKTSSESFGTPREQQSRNTNNTGLPDSLKSGIESLSGYSMDDVKVHYNSSKPAQLQAYAYAQGTDIHLASGQEKHLPHEAWHVVQQKQGRVKPTMQFKGKVKINDDAGLEKEADLMGEKAISFSAGDQHEQAQLPAQATTGKIVQRAKGDYKKLWNKNPAKAHEIIENDIGNYWIEARAFEQALGAGLFDHILAHKGADTMIYKIIDLLGEKLALEVFGSKPTPKEAGAITPDKVKEAITVGSLREKMYMVYVAITSTEIMKRWFQEDHPEERMPKTNVLFDQIRRRDSVKGQGRKVRKGTNESKKTMTAAELNEKKAPLSYREKMSAEGVDPQFLPGQEVYDLNGKLLDSSHPVSGEERKVTFEEYALERLALLAAGLSGTTDWYFSLAKKFKFSNNEKLWLRIASLGQLLVNRDHSYHEIMHVSRTQGKIDDYPDELPIGYTTLKPFNEDDILRIVGQDEFPGDKQAAAYLKNNKLENEAEGVPKSWVTKKYD